MSMFYSFFNAVFNYSQKCTNNLLGMRTLISNEELKYFQTLLLP